MLNKLKLRPYRETDLPQSPVDVSIIYWWAEDLQWSSTLSNKPIKSAHYCELCKSIDSHFCTHKAKIVTIQYVSLYNIAITSEIVRKTLAVWIHYPEKSTCWSLSIYLFTCLINIFTFVVAITMQLQKIHWVFFISHIPSISLDTSWISLQICVSPASRKSSFYEREDYQPLCRF